MSNEIKTDYTSNQDIQYLMEAEEDDYNIEFTGYVAESFGVQFSRKTNEPFYKAVITNGDKRIILLIWNRDQMDNLLKELVPGRILHLDGCQGHLVTHRKEHKELNVLNYEIIIQKNSVVTMKGFHKYMNESMDEAIPTIQFLEIAKVTGEIRVKAYVKTVPATAANKDGNLNFANGSITEGVHKVPIQVNAFKPGDAQHLSKGLCILIQGKISDSGSLRIICTDISGIEVLSQEAKLSEEVVSKANKPLKRSDSAKQMENGPPTKKLRDENARTTFNSKIPLMEKSVNGSNEQK